MRHLLAIALAFVSLSACSASSTTDFSFAPVVGTYALTTVNGAPLPYTEQAASPVVKLTAAQLVARSDGTFTETTTRNTTAAAGNTTDVTIANGTYSVGGTVISFNYGVTGTSLGSITLGGGGISRTVGAVTYVYIKQ